MRRLSIVTIDEVRDARETTIKEEEYHKHVFVILFCGFETLHNLLSNHEDEEECEDVGNERWMVQTCILKNNKGFGSLFQNKNPI